LKKLKDDFPRVTCPVYIFHGDKDENVPVENAEYMTNKLVNSKSVNKTIFPEADHSIVWNKYYEIKTCLLNLEKN